MKIIMVQTARGSANKYGNETRMYNEGEEIILDEPWKESLAQNFVIAGLAKEVKVVEVQETKRARNDDGTLKADDPSTPDVNEAWEGGKAPKKSARSKKK
tara:strand:- start:901 stop:1200 length:300 start_codon:yes stop_codon:yes gene_type:complete